MSSTEMIIPFRIILLRLMHEKRCILWNQFMEKFMESYGKNVKFIFAIPMF